MIQRAFLLGLPLAAALVTSGLAHADASNPGAAGGQPSVRAAQKRLDGKARRPLFGFVRVLVKRGVLTPADLSALQGFKRKIGACFRAARDAAGKPRCISPRRALTPAQRAAVDKTLAPLFGVDPRRETLARACFRRVEAAERSAPKARCRALRGDFLKAQRATYRKALQQLDPAKDAALIAKAKRFLDWLQKSHARVKAKLRARRP